MHSLKTGALIGASVVTGAILSGATEAQQSDLEKFSAKIGLAFQVADDILNVEGDPDLLGKAIGTDANRQKSTYPALLGLHESKEYARNLVDLAILHLTRFDTAAEPLRAIARYVVERNK